MQRSISLAISARAGISADTTAVVASVDCSADCADALDRMNGCDGPCMFRELCTIHHYAITLPTLCPLHLFACLPACFLLHYHGVMMLTGRTTPSAQSPFASQDTNETYLSGVFCSLAVKCGTVLTVLVRLSPLVSLILSFSKGRWASADNGRNERVIRVGRLDQVVNRHDHWRRVNQPCPLSLLPLQQMRRNAHPGSSSSWVSTGPS